MVNTTDCHLQVILTKYPNKSTLGIHMYNHWQEFALPRDFTQKNNCDAQNNTIYRGIHFGIKGKSNVNINYSEAKGSFNL